MTMMLPGSSMAFSSAPSFLQKAQVTTNTKPRYMSDFSDFAYIDDDEDLDMEEYAEENDSQEYKAELGATRVAPEIENDAEPIVVPQGSVLPLTVENVCGLLSACREEIGTMFGYSAENRGVGITGGVDFVELDGPMVVLRLKGRFWHQRPTVLTRVGAYLQSRIPEIIDVIIEDEYQLTDEANTAAE
eukprot:CAMPEP_0198292102 /NCGR_PEP_ID=MMETSP1449-20131203/9877_1 /TAXON_ID=420275 /ORGANISM="Attheya septentrionalis, Strain CCMP2084" /LENGTH=187 /DNA_ID=CAMNT_0043990825 /DNA_START=93 /DNA_END=653 /DNA_ORIENTATION=+